MGKAKVKNGQKDQGQYGGGDQAIVVIGGLITATALTLILLPVLYLRFAHGKTDTTTDADAGNDANRLEASHV